MRESKSLGFFCENLTKHTVESFSEIEEKI